MAATGLIFFGGTTTWSLARRRRRQGLERYRMGFDSVAPYLPTPSAAFSRPCRRWSDARPNGGHGQPDDPKPPIHGHHPPLPTPPVPPITSAEESSAAQGGGDASPVAAKAAHATSPAQVGTAAPAAGHSTAHEIVHPPVPRRTESTYWARARLRDVPAVGVGRPAGQPTAAYGLGAARRRLHQRASCGRLERRPSGRTASTSSP